MKIDYDHGKYQVVTAASPGKTTNDPLPVATVSEHEIKIRIIENFNGTRAYMIDCGKMPSVEAAAILEDFIKLYQMRNRPSLNAEDMRYLKPTLPHPPAPPTRKICTCAPFFCKCKKN